MDGEPAPLLARVAAAASAADREGRTKAAAALHRLTGRLYDGRGTPGHFRNLAVR